MNLSSAVVVNVATGGTPVALAATPTRVKHFRLAPKAGNTGKIWVGLVGMNKATGAGVVDVIFPNKSDEKAKPFEPPCGEGFGPHDLSQYVIDADTNGEGVYRSTWEA